jgi:hypothetical protein
MFLAKMSLDKHWRPRDVNLVSIFAFAAWKLSCNVVIHYDRNAGLQWIVDLLEGASIHMQSSAARGLFQMAK